VPIEESWTLTRKWFVALVAAACAALIPAVAAAQVVDTDRTPPAEAAQQLKWMGYAGFGYTSINQVNGSRYGLIGVDLGINRNFGRFFALTVDGGFFPTSYGSGNPGNPSVSQILAGPEIHGHIFERWNIFGRGLIGGVHTGGNSQTPSVSFAGGVGVGAEYEWSQHLVLRAMGDDIGSSFSLINNSAELGNSPHFRWNAHASIGVGYRF
jgi:opacity protein-like surface antigen